VTLSNGEVQEVKIDGNLVVVGAKPGVDVIERLDLKEIKSIQDLKTVTQIDRGDVVWKLIRDKSSLTLNYVNKANGKVSQSYKIVWSK
jgi:hypothetical protein